VTHTPSNISTQRHHQNNYIYEYFFISIYNNKKKLKCLKMKNEKLKKDVCEAELLQHAHRNATVEVDRLRSVQAHASSGGLDAASGLGLLCGSRSVKRTIQPVL
jgi:hypothetical protein